MIRTKTWRRWGVIAAGLVAVACTREPEPPRAIAKELTPARSASPRVPASQSAPAAPPTAAPAASPAKIESEYPWLKEPGAPTVAGRLDERLAPPLGFSRVALAPGSFGAWLRRLPLAPAGTAVKSHRGGIILPPDHDHLAAVVAIDVGAQDLQQCADSILRLHAEWRWSRGARDIGYRAAAGTPLPFARWALGDRVSASGASIAWSRSARPIGGARTEGEALARATHADLRVFLDTVFAWANTGSLARDTRPIAQADIHPGDFVVQPGGPGHAVIVLDVAKAPDGRRVALLAQGFMPAQNLHVLRPSRDATWFSLDGSSLATPFWPAFAWTALRRFDGT